MPQTRWLSLLLPILFAGSLGVAFTARSAAPQVKTQGPGYYRTMLGDFEVTALLDGVLDLAPKDLLQNMPPAEIDAHLARAFQADKIPTSVNAYLVNTGSRLVLIDAGTGTLFGPSLGKLPDSLKASGYQPGQVDDIVITHMHGDHVGGLTLDGKRVFPNAVVHADRRDAEHFLDAANLEKASADAKGPFQMAQASLDAYVKAGKVAWFDKSAELWPGIRAIPAYGHTPGHTIYAVESKGAKLVLWGDLIHVASVQFEQPQITVNFDDDPKQAAAARKVAFDDAAKGRFLVGASHLSFPGLGHLRIEGSGYGFVPIDYDPVH